MLVGIAAISLAGNSKAARRSAQKGILADPRLTLLFSDHRKIPPIRRLTVSAQDRNVTRRAK
jgi:hypothetical protein